MTSCSVGWAGDPSSAGALTDVCLHLLRALAKPRCLETMPERRSRTAEGNLRTKEERVRTSASGYLWATRMVSEPRLTSFPLLPSVNADSGIRVCAGEAGCHTGESPARRIGLFTTESTTLTEPSGCNDSEPQPVSLETNIREPSRYPNGEGCHAQRPTRHSGPLTLGGVPRSSDDLSESKTDGERRRGADEACWFGVRACVTAGGRDSTSAAFRRASRRSPRSRRAWRGRWW